MITIAVAGPKGGGGKTAASAHLAVQLSRNHNCKDYDCNNASHNYNNTNNPPEASTTLKNRVLAIDADIENANLGPRITGRYQDFEGMKSLGFMFREGINYYLENYETGEMFLEKAKKSLTGQNTNELNEEGRKAHEKACEEAKKSCLKRYKKKTSENRDEFEKHEAKIYTSSLEGVINEKAMELYCSTSHFRDVLDKTLLKYNKIKDGAEIGILGARGTVSKLADLPVQERKAARLMAKHLIKNYFNDKYDFIILDGSAGQEDDFFTRLAINSDMLVLPYSAEKDYYDSCISGLEHYYIKWLEGVVSREIRAPFPIIGLLATKATLGKGIVECWIGKKIEHKPDLIEKIIDFFRHLIFQKNGNNLIEYDRIYKPEDYKNLTSEMIVYSTQKIIPSNLPKMAKLSGYIQRRSIRKIKKRLKKDMNVSYTPKLNFIDLPPLLDDYKYSEVYSSGKYSGKTYPEIYPDSPLSKQAETLAEVVRDMFTK